MKKTSGGLLILAAVLGLFILTSHYQNAAAFDPTPTPTPPASLEPVCHLALGESCTMGDELDFAATEATQNRIYPSLAAQGVPTYTLISATFDRPMDSTSFTPETFYLTQGSARLVGSLSYQEVSRQVIFWPETPLQPGTTYTATIAPAVRYLSGEPLDHSRVWTFTTTTPASVSALNLDLDGMHAYFGDLHNHTSYSDGQGTPALAYLTGRANGLDFMAITDHCFLMDQTEWEDVKKQATAATVSGQFVALSGFEYTNLYGHINVFGSDTYVQRSDSNYDTLAEFYNWLITQPSALAQFNHPRKNAIEDWNFHDFALNRQADLKMVLQELESTSQFFLSLNTGWHLGTLRNRDNHSANWGCCPLMGVVAAELTPQAILEALRARRTFFVSPHDSNLALVMQANGYWMGSALPSTSPIYFTVTVYDPDPDDRSLHLRLYENGVSVASTTLSARTTYTWKPVVTGNLGHYYYAEAYYNGWYYPAYSSPIWVERAPLAEAGPAQIVVPGQGVVLDGRDSSDADGQALAYRWTQDSGPSVSLDDSGSAQPAFVAPSTAGEAVLRLTVTDPGGLSATDTTQITITTAPVLSISKTGPATADSGKPITYLLTVTNRGVTPASGVVITDTLPVGATYVSGGTLLGNIVSWTVDLPANGGTAQVSFMVTATRPLVNYDYGAACSGCLPAKGSVAVFTNADKLYLPLIHRN